MSLALPNIASPRQQPLADQLLALRRHWRLILLCALLAPGVAALVLLAAPHSYSATGILLYDPSLAVLPGSVASDQGMALDEDAIAASQGAIIASLPAASIIASQLNLAASPDFVASLRRRIFPFSLLRRPAALSATELARQVQSRFNTSIQPGSRVISVSFTAASPELAAQAVNLAMQIYLDHERDVSFQALSDAQSWLEAHSAIVQQQLDDTETKLAKARTQAGMVEGPQGTLTVETASQMAASLVTAQADLAMAQARLAAASRQGGDEAAANAAIAPNLLPLRTQQANLAAQVHSLSGEYGAGYPPLAAAHAQLAAVTAQIDAETARELDAAKAEMAADKAQVATLQSALAGARSQSQAEDEEAAPIRALEQRAEAGRDMLRAITLQAGQLAQDASLTRPDARILSNAIIPVQPVPRHGLMILAASSLLGLSIGVLLAGLLDALDTSLRAGSALRSETGLSCHALLPEVKNPAEAALTEPFSLYAEQLHALRTGLGLGEEGCRVLAVTAARPDEGKTTLCISLARSLAASGLKVLAIDGDMRQPGFNGIFGTTGARGLTDYLAGDATLEECLCEDHLSSLVILPAGTHPRAALRLFLSNGLRVFLKEMQAAYDIVLLDVPPAFALAEGRVLARHADGALLCVRWGHTPKRIVHGAQELLHEAGVRLAGAVLTRVDARAHGRSGHADAEFYSPLYVQYFPEIQS